MTDLNLLQWKKEYVVNPYNLFSYSHNLSGWLDKTCQSCSIAAGTDNAFEHYLSCDCGHLGNRNAQIDLRKSDLIYMYRYRRS